MLAFEVFVVAMCGSQATDACTELAMTVAEAVGVAVRSVPTVSFGGATVEWR